jgi:hypothetical protein
MSETKPVALAELSLDLKNYRTVKQTGEAAAISAMVSSSPDRFWALAKSLLDDGYLPTENVVVLRSGEKLIVREGNRRVAALKLIHKLVKTKGLEVPDDVVEAMEAVTDDWKAANKSVPCAIYPSSEAKTVDRIVALAHGKGQQASRENWTAVARARHARDEEGSSQPGLDLLEKYLKDTKSITRDQATRWGADYKITVLDEAVKRIAPRLGFKSSAALAKAYPEVKNRKSVDAIINKIGHQSIGFKEVRAFDFGNDVGLPGVNAEGGGKAGTTDGEAETGSGGGTAGAGGSGAGSSGNGSSAGAKSSTGKQKNEATSINDPRTVATLLGKFKPVGPNRQKVKTLLVETTKIKLEKTPFAFCFLLRSMFEVSAKAYCVDHAADGLSATKNGQDKTLVNVLREITKHLTAGGTDKLMEKRLHGAITELAKQDGLLSVTSMNQLIHSQLFSVLPGDIAGVFGNIFPLLEAMNA